MLTCMILKAFSFSEIELINSSSKITNLSQSIISRLNRNKCIFQFVELFKFLGT